MSRVRQKIATFNQENERKGEIPDRHRNDTNVTKFSHVKWNEDAYLKSEGRDKLCTLKDLNLNGDYLIKGKRKMKKADSAIKNNQLILQNKYDYFLKKKNDTFAIQNGNNMSYNMENIEDIYYVYRENSDICDLIIKRYHENIYLSIFNNMLIIINPHECVHAFYKLVFKRRNRNNYIFSSFINYALQKKVGKGESEFESQENSDDASDDNSGEDDKNVFSYLWQKKMFLGRRSIFHFDKFKKRKKNLTELKKELYVKSNDEIAHVHKDILGNSRIDFNELFNIRTDPRGASMDGYGSDSLSGSAGGTLSGTVNGTTNDIANDSVSGTGNGSFGGHTSDGLDPGSAAASNSGKSCVHSRSGYQPGSMSKRSTNPSRYKNLVHSKDPHVNTSYHGNKLIFICGEKNSNQNVVSTYLFKHVIKKGKNKALYHAYKNVMNVLNLFFNYKCYNFIIHLSSKNRLLYFNVLPCFLTDKSNVTNICTKIGNFLESLNWADKQDKKGEAKSSHAHVREDHHKMDHSECSGDGGSKSGRGEQETSNKYEHRKKKKKKKKKKAQRGGELHANSNSDSDSTIADRTKEKEQRRSKGRGSQDEIFNVPYIFFFLLGSILLDSSNKYYKHLKLHPLDIRKIYKNYVDPPADIEIKESDISRTFDYFLELGFTEGEILSMIKLNFALIFINIYISIRTCLHKNEEETLNFLQLQLINVQDYKKLVTSNAIDREGTKASPDYSKQSSLNFLNFTNEKYLSSDFSSFTDEEKSINCIRQVLQNGHSEEKATRVRRLKNGNMYNRLDQNLDIHLSNGSHLRIVKDDTAAKSGEKKNDESNKQVNNMYTNTTSRSGRRKGSNYFIVFAGHIMEEYISFLLGVDLKGMIKILNNQIRLKNLCSTIFFRLKIRIIKQINEYLRTYFLKGTVAHSLYVYSNSGLSANISEGNKNASGQKKYNNLSQLINNIYNEILHHYYLKMSTFNMDSYLVHTIKALNLSREENYNPDSAIGSTVEQYRRLSDHICRGSIISSYVSQFGKDPILHLLEKYTYKFLHTVENCQEVKGIRSSVVLKAEYYKMMYLYCVEVSRVVKRLTEGVHSRMICDQGDSANSSDSLECSGRRDRGDPPVGTIHYKKDERRKGEIKLADEEYAEKMLLKLMDKIAKGDKKECHVRGGNLPGRRKKIFSIVHYNDETVTYRCNNMILDNAEDFCVINDTIQIIEKSKMEFLRKLFFENSFPLKNFKSNFLYDEICFFSSVIKNTYEKFFVLLLNERERTRQDTFLVPKYMTKYARGNGRGLNAYYGGRRSHSSSNSRSGSSEHRSNIFREDVFFPPSANRPFFSGMTGTSRKFFLNSATTSGEEITDFSELNKKINKEHIKSVIDMLNLKQIFNYQLKYLYHSLTCLDFIKKYLLFCIHVSRDGDLIKLVNYYELRCKKKRENNSCVRGAGTAEQGEKHEHMETHTNVRETDREGANGDGSVKESANGNDASSVDENVATNPRGNLPPNASGSVSSNRSGNDVHSSSGSIKGNLIGGRTSIDQGSSLQSHVTKKKETPKNAESFYYLNCLNLQDKKDLCTIILYNFNISKNTFYFRDFIFLSKYVYFILENLRAKYVKSIVPYVRKIENCYLSYKNRKIKFFLRDKIVIIQNYMRRFLFLERAKTMERRKNLLVSFILFYSYIVKNKNFDETKETLELCKENFMKNEKKLIRHAASVYIQSWYRKIIQQRKYRELKREQFQKKAIENINSAIRTYLVQVKIVQNLNEIVIPNKAAVLIQSYFRRYMCLTNFQKKLFLKICFLSIKRKYLSYSNVLTKVNYHYLIKNIYSRNIIQSQFKIPEAAIKIQSNYKGYVVRKQFNMLMEAIYFTQAYINTCIERIRYNKMKKSIILIQRWWKNFYKLRRIFSQAQFNMYSSEYDKNKYYFLQKNNFPFYKYYILKEKKALKLLTYHILLKQWYFFYFKKFQKKNHQFNIVFNLKMHKNVSRYYTLPWAYKINSILKIIHMEQMFQNCTNNSQNTIFNIPVFGSIQIFVGGTHTILLISQSVINETVGDGQDGFTTTVRKSNTYGNRKNYYAKFVYSLGSNDYGQLGYYNLFEKNFIYHTSGAAGESPCAAEGIQNSVAGSTMGDLAKTLVNGQEELLPPACSKQIQPEGKNRESSKDVMNFSDNSRRRCSSTCDTTKRESTFSSVGPPPEENKTTASVVGGNSRPNPSGKGSASPHLKEKNYTEHSLCSKYKKNIQHLIFEHKRKFTIDKKLFSNTHGGESMQDIVDYQIIDKKNAKGENEKIVEFTKVVSETNKIASISCGSEHTLALSENGNVYSWGSNLFGQCGQKYERSIVRYPKIIKHFLKNKIKIKNISCASYHSGYICRKGDLYMSGNFFFINLKYFQENVYQPVFLISGCHSILCNDSYNVCLRSDRSSLYIWGNNYKCILGLNKKKLRNLDEISIYPLTFLSPNISVIKIACSDNFVCLIAKPGNTKHSVYMWGQFALIEKSEQKSSPVVSNTFNVFNKFRIKPKVNNLQSPDPGSENKGGDAAVTRGKIIFIANPSPVHDPLWDAVEAIDVCCDLDEILVLMNNLCLYGFSAVEIISSDDKKEKKKETNLSYSYYGRREMEQKKEKKIIYEEPEIYDNIKLLTPSLYMFKYFKPSYFNIKKITCSYNRNSLSIMNAAMGEYEIPTVVKKMEFVTPSGDVMQFPEKIREAILAKAKRESNKWIKSNDDPYINHFLIKNSSDSDSVN
ncbi:Uncharacterized protein PCOAH_00054940 [Plasmodium coatneyi]|uniref:Cell cycle associated protein n=1 Tax=Plasmodium coatneyi TaxID=208452 RepID=A0A1B1E846_9APIC|nr:Uncharacterized protein PCOAH_00054940 [Plasmodium coatneyi]ANQ10939.1 Uncharacterized protein PCOAH_00054940 [Plasmodium coatneyi]